MMRSSIRHAGLRDVNVLDMSALDWGLDPRTWAVVPALVSDIAACTPDASVDVLLDTEGRPLLDVEVCGVVDSVKEATSYQQLEISDGTGLLTVTTFRQQQGDQVRLPHVEPGDIVLARGRAGMRYRPHVDDPDRRQVSGKAVFCWAGEAPALPTDRGLAAEASGPGGSARGEPGPSSSAVPGRPLVGAPEDGDAVLARHWARCAGRGGASEAAVWGVVEREEGREKRREKGDGGADLGEGAPSFGVTNDAPSGGRRSGAAVALEPRGGGAVRAPGAAPRGVPRAGDGKRPASMAMETGEAGEATGGGDRTST